MGIKNTAAFKAANNSLITTNGVGDISGADANAMFTDVADSFTNKDKNQYALATNSTTWDVKSFDEANANVTITNDSHTINVTNISVSGNYTLLVVKNNGANPITLTITSSVAVQMVNSNVLEGADGKFFMVHLQMRGSLVATFHKALRIVDDTSPVLGANLDANSNKIINLAAPTSANDAARLADVNAVTHPYNYTATTDPGATNDLNDTGASNGVGYEIGSKWLNTTSGEWFMAVDVTDGAAVWEKISLTVDELDAIAVSGLTNGNGTTANGTAVDLGGTVSGNILLLVPDDGTTFVIQKANGGTTYSSTISVEETLLEIGVSDGVSEETKFSFNLNTGVCTLSATAADTFLYPQGSNATNANGLINKTYVDKIRPSPSALTDGSAISWDWSSKYFELKTLTTTNTAITLTLSNVVAGANQILSIVKNTASDVTISLAGTGLSFYGYNNADYGTTPDIVLSGASGDIFDISFLARTATSIGVAVGQNGN